MAALGAIGIDRSGTLGASPTRPGVLTNGQRASSGFSKKIEIGYSPPRGATPTRSGGGFGGLPIGYPIG